MSENRPVSDENGNNNEERERGSASDVVARIDTIETAVTRMASALEVLATLTAKEIVTERASAERIAHAVEGRAAPPLPAGAEQGAELYAGLRRALGMKVTERRG
jgi:hypothetical protein